MFEEIFCHKKAVPQKLADYSFAHTGNGWEKHTRILDGEFTLDITVTQDGDVDTQLTESATDEPYVLYKTPAQGAFVGEVRKAIEAVLVDVAQHCFETAVFKSAQTVAAIDYVRKTYGDEPEFLWQKFPDNAVWRRKDTGTWYGAILTTQKNKLGLSSNEKIEIVDLRIAPEQMEALLKRKHYYPGWHMNKKHWFTVILDGSISDSELFRRIDESFVLTKK